MPAGEAEDLREFIRQITLRVERTNRDLIEAMSKEFRAQRDDFRQELRAQRSLLDAIWTEVREQRAETRAQTQALFRILDKLDNGGAAPAA